MGTIETIRKMFFIMDCSGNFYRLDSDGQLVVADGKEDAVFFTYEEADSKIGNGKRSQFYRIVQAAESTDESCAETKSNSEITTTDTKAEADCREYETMKPEEERAGWENPMKKWSAPELADLSEIDWLLYLQNFSYIVANIQTYREQIARELPKADQTISDILHYVEFYDPDEWQTKEIMDRLKAAREYRRDIKNELVRIDQFRTSIGSAGNAASAEKAVRMIRRTENQNYRPRILEDLFEGAPEEERREIRCFQEMASRYETTEPAGVYEESAFEDPEYEQEGAIEEMDMERRDTIYDGAQTDWDAFVKGQADFFRNVRQYIINLRIDIEILDREIEDMLVRCEEEKCNVTQGYKMFRMIKDLRIEKKMKLMELQKVSAIADRFDCDIMQDIFEEIEEELGIAPVSSNMNPPVQKNAEDVSQEKIVKAAEDKAIQEAV